MLIFVPLLIKSEVLISTDLQQQITELIEEEFVKLELPDEPHSLYEPVRYTLSLGGKRVRPYFTLAGCGLCDGAIEDALPAAIAIELLHNFTLLHDDIMDSALTRRGKPSVFKKWDASTAILSGDAMYAWAFEQLQYYGAKDRFSKDQYHSILAIFLKSAKTVCEGQAYDIDFEKEVSVSLENYIHMIEGKTAALISGSLAMGGMVAGADETSMARLQKIGNHAGIAFQIQDDLLDVVADPEKFGKQRGGDILEGKKTFLSILSLHRAEGQTLDDLQRAFREKNVLEDKVESVIDYYEELGVITTAETIIREHYDQAIELIDLFDASPYKADLIEFLTNLKNREY